MPSQNDRVLIIEVTIDDIRKASPSHGASSCPVATAIGRATGSFALVGWHNANIYWGDKKKVTNNYSKPVGTEYDLDRETTSRIKRYDDVGVMHPFRATLTKTGERARLITSG